MDKQKRNYHKESGYVAQRKWSAEHLSIINIAVHKEQKEMLVNLAKENEMSLSQLIKSAIDAKYGTTLAKK